MSAQRKVVTSHVCPPVPTTMWDWIAYVEDDEEDSHTGSGPTEVEALRDLAERLLLERDALSSQLDWIIEG